MGCVEFGSLEMELRDVVTIIVVPDPRAGDPEKSKLVEHLGCELNSFDLRTSNSYVPFLLLFDAAPGLGFARLVEELKASLGRALVPFHPLAGTVVQKPGHPPRLLCNNAGAVFTSARVDAPLSQVYRGVEVSDSFQPVPQISGISTKPMAEAGVDPALVVQVTGFQCGGVALAVNWMHYVVDAFGVTQFLKAWSDACGGGTATPEPEPEPEPDHCRAQALKKAHFLDGAFSDRELGADHTPPGLEHVAWTRDMPAAVQALQAAAHHTPSVRLVQYTEASITKLKALAAGNTGQHFSTVTCVSAHLWRCIARASLRNAIPGEETCRLMFGADAKVRRIGTSTRTLLPASYFGNSIVVVQTREVEAEEVAEQPVGFAASLIHDSLASIDLRAYQYMLALSDKHGAANIRALPRGRAHDLGTTSWYRFPLYHLRFGFPAQPVLAVYNGAPFPLLDGFAFFLPSPLGPNNLTAMLYAKASLIATLFSDQGFLDYAY